MLRLGAGLLALGPAAAFACVIQPTECTTAAGLALLEGVQGDRVLFREWLDDLGRTTSRIILVECTGRQGVMVMDRNRDEDWDAVNAARALFDRVLYTPTPLDPDRILTEARALGADATRVELGPAHCGCDLPGIEAPPTMCPEM